MHDRVSVDALAFPDDTLETIMEHFRALAPHRVSFLSQQITGELLPEARRLLQGSSYRVETVCHPLMAPLADRAAWDVPRARLLEAIRAAEAIGAKSVYTLAGNRGGLTWEEAAEAFAEVIEPCKAPAAAAGLDLLVEPAPPLYADLHIAHTLRDAVLLAEIADIGICMDVFACWTEAGLKETIERAGPRIRLVQVGDYVLGDRAVPSRAVVGEGAIPLKRIFGWTLEAGFEGAFDLELVGPRIVEIGRFESVRRSAENMSEILRELGA